jgi:two-component system, chemotaxis family, protein-glutamate methylesterase/glutaminase
MNSLLLDVDNLKCVVIGGSAGSFRPVCNILSSLPSNFNAVIILCLHRLKNVNHGFAEALTTYSNHPITEPYDKQPIEIGKIYLAPSNYHLCIANDFTFNLSTDDMINFSRPSIDLTYHTVGEIFKEKTIGIILSGANRDGVKGIQTIYQNGGKTLAQDPSECQAPTMPQGAIHLNCIQNILSENEIINYLNTVLTKPQ